MLSASSIRGWYLVHKWTSLVSTLFLLMLCITGLPLIFYHEIDHALGYSIDPPERPGVTTTASLDQILDHVWHYDFGGNSGVVESYISYLRRKIDVVDPPLIHTVRGVGYVLRTKPH